MYPVQEDQNQVYCYIYNLYICTWNLQPTRDKQSKGLTILPVAANIWSDWKPKPHLLQQFLKVLYPDASW